MDSGPTVNTIGFTGVLEAGLAVLDALLDLLFCAFSELKDTIANESKMAEKDKILRMGILYSTNINLDKIFLFILFYISICF
jgi:hypothetical protein